MKDIQPEWIDAICPFCSCLCDDLKLRIEGNHPLEIYPACTRAEDAYKSCSSIDILPQVDNVNHEWDRAIHIAAEKISAAHLPVVLLGRFVSREICTCAIDLAWTISGCADVITTGLKPDFHWMTETGIQTCSIGEMREKAGVVVLWGISLLNTHPRFWDRYITSGKKKDIIAINSSLPRQLDLPAINFDTHQLVEIIVNLRLALKGEKIEDAGIKELLDHLKKSNFTVFLLGEQFFKQDAVSLTEIQFLIKDLEKLTASRCFSTLIKEDPDQQCGQAAMLGWAGVPGSIKLDPLKIDFSPSEYSIDHLLQKRCTDLLVCIGEPTGLGVDYINKKEKFDMILIGPRKSSCAPSIWLPSGQIGWDDEGTIYNLDDLPVCVPSIIPSIQPSMTSILQKLKDYVA